MRSLGWPQHCSRLSVDCAHADGDAGQRKGFDSSVILGVEIVSVTMIVGCLRRRFTIRIG